MFGNLDIDNYYWRESTRDLPKCKNCGLTLNIIIGEDNLEKINGVYYCRTCILRLGLLDNKKESK